MTQPDWTIECHPPHRRCRITGIPRQPRDKRHDGRPIPPGRRYQTVRHRPLQSPAVVNPGADMELNMDMIETENDRLTPRTGKTTAGRKSLPPTGDNDALNIERLAAVSNNIH